MGDMEGLDPLLEGEDLDEEVEFLVGFGCFLSPVEEAEALLEKSLFIEDVSVVEHFVQLEVDAIGAFEKAEAGQDLFVQMGFKIGQLRFLDAGQLFEEAFFVVVVQFVEGVEKLDDLEILFGGAAVDI
jgi:hypothetical protein